MLDRIRTYHLGVRTATLYPNELRAHIIILPNFLYNYFMFNNRMDLGAVGGNIAMATTWQEDEYGELFLEDCEKLFALFSNNKLEKLQILSEAGYSIRHVRKRQKRFEVHQLRKDKHPIDSYTQKTSYISFANITLSMILDLLREINDFFSSYTFIKNTIISLNLSSRDIWIYTHIKHLIYDPRYLFSLRVELILEENGIHEKAAMSFSKQDNFSTLLSGWQKHATDLLKRAKIILQAKPCKGGNLPVLLGPGVTGILLHEAIGHGLEADFHAKKSSVFYNKLNTMISGDFVNIYDDGTINNARGSIAFDDEGTESRKNILVENGRLVGLMCDKFFGEEIGRYSTGNGRRQSFKHYPMPRMTNTYMDRGPHSVEEMISSIKEGIYGVDFSHGQVDITSGNFAFSGSLMYWIQDGKISHPVRGCTLSGLGINVLAGILGVGNDLAFDPSGGTCGKNGQWVPVGVGQPSILINSLMVGSRV